jgi:hypothetical protein
MGRKIFNVGEEIVRQDQNDAQSLMEREYNDDVLYRLFGGMDGFIANSFKVEYVSPTLMNIQDGRGFQYDASQVTPEPNYRGIDIDAIVPQAIMAADATFPRIDIICVKSIRVVTETATRKFKATPASAITNQLFDKTSNYSAQILYVPGTAQASPVAPAVPAGYLPLARINVPASTGPMSQADIIDTRSLLQVATSLGVGVNTLGKTALTTLGANTPIQKVIDELDPYVKANHDEIVKIEDSTNIAKGAALVGLKVASPGQWIAEPHNAKAALDEIAGRVVAVEGATAGQDYTDKAFDDYVTEIPTNPGLTDTLLTNPRQISVSQLQTLLGEDRILCWGVAKTGNYDSNGLPEWEITVPKKDNRVRLYGSSWQSIYNDAGQLVYTSDVGDYILVTGVMDAFAMLTYLGGDAPSTLDIKVDNVSTGIPINTRGTPLGIGTQENIVISDQSLKGFSQDLHTIRITNQSGDASSVFRMSGFTLINSTPLQLGGAAYVHKGLQTFSKAAITPVVVGNKGGKIVRFIDRADNTIKELGQSCKVLETLSSSIGAGSTTLAVNNATGFKAGDIITLSDTLNHERVLVSSVNTGTNSILLSTATVNAYTNATIALTASTFSNADHSNEEVVALKPWRAYSNNKILTFKDFSYGSDVNSAANCHMDDEVSSMSVVTGYDNYDAGADSFGIRFTASGTALKYTFKGTGLDILMRTGTGNPTQINDFVFAVYVDEVLIGTLTPASLKTKWYKICSDLPDGNHSVTFIGTGSLSYAFFLAFKEYQTKSAAPLALVPKGNILSSRQVSANFRSYVGQIAPSEGVLRTPINRGTLKREGAGPGIGLTYYEGTTASGMYVNGNLLQLHQAGAFLSRWFFGTGVEVLSYGNPSCSIGELRIDGNLVTSGNFPSATISGLVNPATGLFDTYVAGATYPNQKSGIQGLPLGWHEVKVTATYTKNAGSSAYDLNIEGFDIIGGFMEGVTPKKSFRPSCRNFMGGAKDLRVLDPAFILSVDNSHSSQEVNNYTYALNTHPGARGSILILETDGGEIETDSVFSHYGTAGATVYSHINIDDIQDFGNAEIYTTYYTTGIYNENTQKKKKKLPAGIHVIQTKVLVNAASVAIPSLSAFAKELGKGGKNS